MEHAHEIHALIKELKYFSYVFPDCLWRHQVTPSWRDFVTSIKHKIQDFNVVDLIGSLDDEEKARAKYTCRKGVESPMPIWCIRKI